jgi:hypothetical protein
MIKKVTKKPVAKKAVAKKVVKKAVPKMQDGGVTRRRLKQAGVSKDEYKATMADNSRMSTLPAGKVAYSRRSLEPLKDKSGMERSPAYLAERSARRPLTGAAMDAGALEPGSAYRSEEITNLVPEADVTKFLKNNPKVVEQLSQFDIQRLRDTGYLPKMKRGGKKATPVMKKGGKVTKGMGFKAAQKQIAKKQGLSMERAGAILAAGARKASPAAKRKNPNLKKVKG